MGDIQSIDKYLREHRSYAPVNAAVNVGVTSTLILASKAARIYALIVNDSDTVIYLALGAAAILHRGIRLNANGGAYEINWTNLHTDAIYGIHGSTGNKVVTTVESETW